MLTWRQLPRLALPWVVALGTLAAAPAHATFVRGDVDGTGKPTIADAIDILWHLFRGATSLDCFDAADSNDDGAIDIADVVHILSHLFAGGPALPPPYPGCGIDPTPDGLGCELSWHCHRGFFGFDPVAGGLFIVIDRSEHMQGNGELSIANREAIRAIQALGPGDRFGVFLADQGLEQSPGGAEPASAADTEAVESTTALLSGATGGSGICVQEALLAAVDMAGRSPAPTNTIFYVGTGRGVCRGDEAVYLRQALDEVTVLNAGRFAIHSVGLQVHEASGLQFLRELAARNGGSFLVVEWD